jgi:hypothetical protein
VDSNLMQPLRWYWERQFVTEEPWRAYLPKSLARIQKEEKSPGACG